MKIGPIGISCFIIFGLENVRYPSVSRKLMLFMKISVSDLSTLEKVLQKKSVSKIIPILTSKVIAQISQTFICIFFKMYELRSKDFLSILV